MKLLRSLTVSSFALLGRGRSRGAIAGGAPGVSAVLFWDAGRDRQVVVLANLDEPISERLGRWIIGAFPDS